jgi:hypothetical protein
MSRQKVQMKRRNDMPRWNMEDREEPPFRPGVEYSGSKPYEPPYPEHCIDDTRIGQHTNNTHIKDQRRANKAIPTILRRIDYLRNRIDQQMKKTGRRLSWDEQELQSLYFLIGIARDVGYTIEIGEESGR